MTKNNHAPSLPEEQINKIVWELSDTSEDELTNLTQQFKEIIDRGKKKLFKLVSRKAKN